MGKVAGATFAEAQAQLVVTVAEAEPAGALTIACRPFTNPAAGRAAGRVAIHTRRGDGLGTPVDSTDGAYLSAVTAAALSGARVRLDKTELALPVTLTVAFAPSTPLAPGNQVVVALPGFSLKSTFPQCNFTGASGAGTSAQNAFFSAVRVPEQLASSSGPGGGLTSSSGSSATSTSIPALTVTLATVGADLAAFPPGNVEMVCAGLIAPSRESLPAYASALAAPGGLPLFTQSVAGVIDSAAAVDAPSFSASSARTVAEQMEITLWALLGVLVLVTVSASVAYCRKRRKPDLQRQHVKASVGLGFVESNAAIQV